MIFLSLEKMGCLFNIGKRMISGSLCRSFFKYWCPGKMEAVPWNWLWLAREPDFCEGAVISNPSWWAWGGCCPRSVEVIWRLLPSAFPTGDGLAPPSPTRALNLQSFLCQGSLRASWSQPLCARCHLCSKSFYIPSLHHCDFRFYTLFTSLLIFLSRPWCPVKFVLFCLSLFSCKLWVKITCKT